MQKQKERMSYEQWEKQAHHEHGKMSKTKFRILHALKSLEAGLKEGYKETKPLRKVTSQVIERVGKNVYEN